MEHGRWSVSYPDTGIVRERSRGKLHLVTRTMRTKRSDATPEQRSRLVVHEQEVTYE